MAAESESHAKIFEILSHFGFGSRTTEPDLIEQKVFSMGLRRLIKLSISIVQSTPSPSSRLQTPFTFIGTQQFAGSPWPCANPDCRLAPADDISRFAALYADHVYLPDPMTNVFLIEDPERDELLFRREMLVSLRLLIRLRPLILAGLVSFIKQSHEVICKGCFMRVWTEVNSDRQTAETDVTAYLLGRFAKEAQFSVETLSEEGKAAIHVTASEDILPCGSLYLQTNKLSGVRTKELQKKFPMKLSHRQVAQNALVYPFVMEILSDIKTQTELSKRLGASYLTTRGIDFDLLRKFGTRDVQGRIPPGPSLFSHMLPTISSV